MSQAEENELRKTIARQAATEAALRAQVAKQAAEIEKQAIGLGDLALANMKLRALCAEKIAMVETKDAIIRNRQARTEALALANVN